MEYDSAVAAISSLAVLLDSRTLPRKFRGALPYLRYRLRGRVLEHVSDGVLRVDTWWGPLLVHERSNSITDQLSKTGVYDLDTCLAVRSIVKPGMTVLNIGANVGLYALLAAKRVGDKGAVYAFEPDQRSFVLLKENATQFPGIIECVPEAISNREGEMTLFLDEAEPGDSSLSEGNTHGASTLVPVTTIDRFCTSRGIQPDVIIMDIQGAEPFALEGARETLMHAKRLTILFECSPKYSENMGASIDHIHALRTELGFHLQHLRSSTLPDPDREWDALIAVLREKKGGYGFCNLLAAK